jgi:hypothetical protein
MLVKGSECSCWNCGHRKEIPRPGGRGATTQGSQAPCGRR